MQGMNSPMMPVTDPQHAPNIALLGDLLTLMVDPVKYKAMVDQLTADIATHKAAEAEANDARMKLQTSNAAIQRQVDAGDQRQAELDKLAEGIKVDRKQLGDDTDALHTRSKELDGKVADLASRGRALDAREAEMTRREAEFRGTVAALANMAKPA